MYGDEAPSGSKIESKIRIKDAANVRTDVRLFPHRTRRSWNVPVDSRPRLTDMACFRYGCGPVLVKTRCFLVSFKRQWQR